MKKRSVIGVVLFPLLTFGIYGLYWFVSTKKELNAQGASIPTAWLIIIPIANIWWMWKYYEAAEQVTNKKVNGILMFVLAFFISSLISNAICQDAYNNLAAAPVGGSAPMPEPAAAAPVAAEASTPENPTAPQAPVA